MRHMAPASVQREEIPLSSSLLCHIKLLNSVLERNANRFAEEHGLTMPQWMALGCIGHCGVEGIRHSELGSRLMLSKAPITGVVDRLERAGYVRRTPDASDRRVSRVTITQSGEAVWKQVRGTLRERSIQLCDCLSAKEQETLVSLLARLLEDAAAGDPISCALGDPNE